MAWYDFLFGGSDQPGYTPAPNRPFPSQEDLEFARKNDAFYDTGTDIPGKSVELTAKNLPSPLLSKIYAEQSYNKLPPVTSQNLIDILARNKLASHRSAISSLGLDNHEDINAISSDVKYPGDYGRTIGGNVGEPMLSLSTMTDDNNVSTPIHEATHRGLYRVLDALSKGSVMDTMKYSRLMDDIRNPDKQEMMVRALMHDKYGNPESGRMPDEYETMLQGGSDLDRAREMNDLAETLAAKLIAKRTPGGPR